jgi:predicted Zn-dependent protease
MQARLSARWFDGVSAQAQSCELGWQDGTLLMWVPDATEPRRYSSKQVVWPERSRHGLRQILLPDGAVVSLPDANAWDSWAEAAGIAQPLAARWAMSWRGVAVALVLLVATVLAAWRWAIPWGAQQLAGWVPESVQVGIGQSVLRDLEGRGWLLPSELPREVRQGINDAVVQMVQMAYRDQPAPRYQLHFYKAPRWLGPNAFALPSGDIVVTDALVTLLQGDGDSVSRALLGVVAHELGHVRERHGLRLVFEAGAVSVLAGWWIGDYSAVLAGAPALAVQAGYSRGHERDADAHALRVMKDAGIDPRAMLQFFQALKEAVPERDGDATAFGLATHPVDSERIRFFEGGAR